MAKLISNKRIKLKTFNRLSKEISFPGSLISLNKYRFIFVKNIETKIVRVRPVKSVNEQINVNTDTERITREKFFKFIVENLYVFSFSRITKQKLINANAEIFVKQNSTITRERFISSDINIYVKPVNAKINVTKNITSDVLDIHVLTTNIVTIQKFIASNEAIYVKTDSAKINKIAALNNISETIGIVNETADIALSKPLLVDANISVIINNAELKRISEKFLNSATEIKVKINDAIVKVKKFIASNEAIYVKTDSAKINKIATLSNISETIGIVNETADIALAKPLASSNEIIGITNINTRLLPRIVSVNNSIFVKQNIKTTVTIESFKFFESKNEVIGITNTDASLSLQLSLMKSQTELVSNNAGELTINSSQTELVSNNAGELIINSSQTELITSKSANLNINNSQTELITIPNKSVDNNFGRISISQNRKSFYISPSVNATNPTVKNVDQIGNLKLIKINESTQTIKSITDCEFNKLFLHKNNDSIQEISKVNYVNNNLANNLESKNLSGKIQSVYDSLNNNLFVMNSGSNTDNIQKFNVESKLYKQSNFSSPVSSNSFDAKNDNFESVYDYDNKKIYVALETTNAPAKDIIGYDLTLSSSTSEYQTNISFKPYRIRYGNNKLYVFWKNKTVANNNLEIKRFDVDGSGFVPVGSSNNFTLTFSNGEGDPGFDVNYATDYIIYSRNNDNQKLHLVPDPQNNPLNEVTKDLSSAALGTIKDIKYNSENDNWLVTLDDGYILFELNEGNDSINIIKQY